jgi:hypothetical protein
MQQRVFDIKYFASRTIYEGRSVCRPCHSSGAWLPTMAAQVRTHVNSCGNCDASSGIEAGYLRVFRFPLPILIPPTAPHSSSSTIWDWYNRPHSSRRTKWTQSHPNPKKLKKKSQYVRSTKVLHQNIFFLTCYQNIV